MSSDGARRAAWAAAASLALGVGVASAPARGGDPASPAPPLTDGRALMLATRAGDVLVGAEVTAGRIRVAVIPPDVRRQPASSVRAVVRSPRGERRVTRPCGWNCLELRGADVLRGRAATLRVEVRRRGRTARGTIVVPARMPVSGAAVYARAQRRMERLRAVRVREVMSNGVSDLRSTWLYQAPDRASYVASNGTRGVIIGDRRWDFNAGRWTTHATVRLRSPRYMWTGATRPRLLGTATRRGRRVQVLSLFRPNGSYPAFFRLYVDRGGRVLQADMWAPAHFMVDTLDRFDAPTRIRPPI